MEGRRSVEKKEGAGMADADSGLMLES